MTGAGPGRKYTTRVFASLTELAEFVRANPSKYRAHDTGWAGGTLTEALERTHHGDMALVAPSEALLAKFEALTFQTPRREWRNEVSGHVANVPAYLAGHPAAMRRRIRAPSEIAPVTVFVDLFASASFTNGEILTRGAAVLALVRVLAAVRPIELYVAFGTTRRSDGATDAGELS